MEYQTQSFKILVCGGRNYTNKDRVYTILDRIHKYYSDICIVQGGAMGADYIAKSWAIDNNIKQHEFKANWNQYGKGAGAIRNQQMLEFDPDLVVAFAGGSGTADMINRSKNAGIKVFIVKEPNTQ